MENERNNKNCKFSSYMRDEAAPFFLSERYSPSSLGDIKPARRRKKGARSIGGAGSFAMLMVCTLAFSLFLALELSRKNTTVPTFNEYRLAMQKSDDEPLDETELGKLRFVELPGLLSVFAPSNTPIAPCMGEKSVIDDEYTARIYAKDGEIVYSVLNGTVRSVDAQLKTVTVSYPDGIEITYYNIDDIKVERAQPVLQKTQLGTLSGDVLLLRVTKDGRPIDPVKYLGAGANIG